MHLPLNISGSATRLASLLVLWLSCHAIEAQETPPGLPPGVVDFAGRLARDHWHLFGAAARPELDALNRELREARQEFEKAGDAASRQSAARRGQAAADNLVKRLQTCPGLLRMDLSSPQSGARQREPIQLPGDKGALLIEANGSGRGREFREYTFDLAQPPDRSWLGPLSVGEGTTYLLVGLEHAPSGRTTLEFAFQNANGSRTVLPADISTPAPGRLKLAVLSDDTAAPVPAMVRLTWRADGQSRPPAGGIEFAPQFDRQGKPSGARTANLPGLQGEPFWCVPGPFDMALPPGTWEIAARRGLEHEIVAEEVHIPAGRPTERQVRPRRWVDMRSLGWWSGDDHVHCRLLSDDDARNLMAWVQAEDIHLANVVKMGDIYRTYFEQRGFGPGHRVIEGDYVLAPGQECPRTHDQIGHTLAMNITDMIRDTDQYYLYDKVFDAVHRQGGLAGYAHANSGMFHVHRDMSLNVPRQKVDFVEILQFNHLGTDLYYDFLNLGCKLTASAGSDVPWGGTVGEVRAYAFLGKEKFSADAWFKAFGRGRTFATSGPMLDLRVDDALPGDEIHLDKDRPVRIRARAWGDPKRLREVTLEIVRHGNVIETAVSKDPARPEATVACEVPAGNGCWISARARGDDGTSAHTTPVYLIREGLRFWRYDGLDSLLAKRQASLQEIESIIAEAKRLNAEGRLEADRYRKQLALQGDALLERVQAARKLYEDLRQVAEREKAIRKPGSP